MRLRVINCMRAVVDGGAVEVYCPFLLAEDHHCMHPARGERGTGIEPGDDSMPTWCPLREGAVSVCTDAIKFKLSAGPITFGAPKKEEASEG